MNAEYFINKFQLKKHPEGGYFNEYYRCKETIPQNCLPERYKNKHTFGTAIYFLITSTDFSKFHRLKSDEIWHFYAGSGLRIHTLTPEKGYKYIDLGPDIENGESFAVLIPANTWFAATVKDDNSYTFFGCTVAPGFDFDDFEMAEREKLISIFPEHNNLITKLTADS